MTEQQRRVVAEVATGATYREVAQRLGIPYQSVKNAMHEAKREAGAKTNVGMYVVFGWLRVPPYDVTLHYTPPDYE